GPSAIRRDSLSCRRPFALDSLSTGYCPRTEERVTMSFRQTYYTSCQQGLRGGKGFQINAATEGIEPSTLQQIERLGLYVPPVSAPSRPSLEEIERFPVSMLFQLLGDRSAVFAQAKYVGTDYSSRFGNY